MGPEWRSRDAETGPRDGRRLSLSTYLGLVTLLRSDQAIFGGDRVRVGTRQEDPDAICKEAISETNDDSSGDGEASKVLQVGNLRSN